MVLLALLPGLWGFLAALALLGLGSGLLDVAPSAMIGDLLGGKGSRSEQGGTVVASYQMAGDIGTVAGPVAVGFLVDRSPTGRPSSWRRVCLPWPPWLACSRRKPGGRMRTGSPIPEPAVGQPHADPA